LFNDGRDDGGGVRSGRGLSLVSSPRKRLVPFDVFLRLVLDLRGVSSSDPRLAFFDLLLPPSACVVDRLYILLPLAVFLNLNILF
jgi:hypothetical protein